MLVALNNISQPVHVVLHRHQQSVDSSRGTHERMGHSSFRLAGHTCRCSCPTGRGAAACDAPGVGRGAPFGGSWCADCTAGRLRGGCIC